MLSANSTMIDRMSSRIIFASLVLSTAALAERVKVVVLAAAADEVDRARALKLMAQLPARLAVDERLEIISLEALSDERAASKRQASQDRGLQRLREAESAWKALDVERATAKFAEAYAEFEQADWRTSFDRYLEALAWTGALEKDQSKLALLFTLRPTFALPPINPEIDAFVSAERQNKASAKKVPFEVRSEVPASVWIDGVFVGVTPFVGDLLAGRHRITATSPGRQLLQRQETITSGAVVQLAFEEGLEGPNTRAGLADTAAGLRTGAFLPPIKRLVEGLKRYEVLVVGLARNDGKLETQVVRMNQLGVASTSMRPAGADELEAVLPQVSALYDRELGVTLTETGQVSLGPTKRTWSYLALAAGGAAALAGVIVLALAGSQFAAAQAIPQTNVVGYEQAIASARGTLGGGIALTSAGLLGVGIGTFLFFSSHPSTAVDVREVEGER